MYDLLNNARFIKSRLISLIINYLIHHDDFPILIQMVSPDFNNSLFYKIFIFIAKKGLNLFTIVIYCPLHYNYVINT